MNGVKFQHAHFNQFTPPSSESLGFRTIVFWVQNVLTLGMNAASTSLSQEHYIRHLKLVQEDLKNQTDQLEANWNQLERELSNLLADEAHAFSDEFDTEDMKEKLEKLSSRKILLQNEEARSQLKDAVSLTEIVFGTVTFVGKLIANLLTLGIYGVYQNHVLRNRIRILEAKNAFIQDQGKAKRDEKFANLQKIIESVNDFFSLRDQINEMKETDSGRAYLAVQKAKQDFEVLKRQQAALQQQVVALSADKVAEEKRRKAAEADVDSKKQEIQQQGHKILSLGSERKKLQAENDRLKFENAQKDNALRSQQQKAKDDLVLIQSQLSAAKAKAEQVQQLERQLAGMQATQRHQPEIVKLAPQLGPVPPKYTKRKEDERVLGAMDIEELEGEELDKLKSYNARYGAKRSAAEVIVASFEHACKQLLEDTDEKFELNHAGDTMSTLGMLAVYRYMVWDLIAGGKVEENGCHGFKLQINANVTMLPSRSEKVLQFKSDAEGKLNPIVDVRYRQRDDFTPDEESLKLRDGVDAVSVKWILEQLSEDEKEILFTHLMAPIIENTHPDYKKMLTFMQRRHDPRVKLVETASDLIQDLAVAFQKKFGKDVLVPSYGEFFDEWNIKPFVKPEDNLKDLEKFAQDLTIQTVAKTVAWELDVDVLGDKRGGDWHPRQPDFYQLIERAQKRYQAVFSYMNEKMLQQPYKPGSEFKKLDMADISKQYYVAHKMIGERFVPCQFGTGDTYHIPGERCLFSNLLAILLIDENQVLIARAAREEKKAVKASADVQEKMKSRYVSYDEQRIAETALKNAQAQVTLAETRSQLTSVNVQKLKNAMAAYLDKLSKAHTEWLMQSTLSSYQKSKNPAQLKELADLSKSFERAIRSTHSCSVPQYQAWLRGEKPYGVNIDVGNLTPFEIQLAAFTIGVRIALLPIKLNAVAKADKAGRILPEAYVFGPSTGEILTMAVSDNRDGYVGTYYGLFPKLRFDDNQIQKNSRDLALAMEVEEYWKSIDVGYSA